MKTVERIDKIRSCYCRRGYGGKVKVCGHDVVRERRWAVLLDGLVLDYFPTKREAVASIKGGAQK
jgi:hypothetical protein